MFYTEVPAHRLMLSPSLMFSPQPVSFFPLMFYKSFYVCFPLDFRFLKISPERIITVSCAGTWMSPTSVCLCSGSSRSPRGCRSCAQLRDLFWWPGKTLVPYTMIFTLTGQAEYLYQAAGGSPAWPRRLVGTHSIKIPGHLKPSLLSSGAWPI